MVNSVNSNKNSKKNSKDSLQLKNDSKIIKNDLETNSIKDEKEKKISKFFKEVLKEEIVI